MSIFPFHVELQCLGSWGGASDVVSFPFVPAVVSAPMVLRSPFVSFQWYHHSYWAWMWFPFPLTINGILASLPPPPFMVSSRTQFCNINAWSSPAVNFGSAYVSGQAICQRGNRKRNGARMPGKQRARPLHCPMLIWSQDVSFSPTSA